MPTEPATCEPPPKHRGVEWHWLRHERYGWWTCARWSGSQLRGEMLFDEDAYDAGWRYVGPARPPKEGE